VANTAFVITGLIAGSCPRYRRIDGGTRGASIGARNRGKRPSWRINKSASRRRGEMLTIAASLHHLKDFVSPDLTVSRDERNCLITIALSGNPPTFRRRRERRQFFYFLILLINDMIWLMNVFVRWFDFFILWVLSGLINSIWDNSEW